MKWIIRLVAAVFTFAVIALCIAIAQPTKVPSEALNSVNAPFSTVDFSALPKPETHTARDGEEISYRRYQSESEAAVALLLHGSSSHGQSLHPLAASLAESGITSYRHQGQMISLVGFSSGGGLALNAAGLGHAETIDQLILLSPMLGPDQPPYTAKNPHRSKDRWASPNIPRIIGLSVLNSVGIHVFDDLSVIAFAVGDIEDLTGEYSHRLLISMTPQDAPALLKAVPVPIKLIVGERDELFAATAFDEAVHPVRPDTAITIVPNLNHIEITLSSVAHDVIGDTILGK